VWNDREFVDIINVCRENNAQSYFFPYSLSDSELDSFLWSDTNRASAMEPANKSRIMSPIALTRILSRERVWFSMAISLRDQRVPFHHFRSQYCMRGSEYPAIISKISVALPQEKM
jgi:hypothetical protein